MANFERIILTYQLGNVNIYEDDNMNDIYNILSAVIPNSANSNSVKYLLARSWGGVIKNNFEDKRLAFTVEDIRQLFSNTTTTNAWQCEPLASGVIGFSAWWKILAKQIEGMPNAARPSDHHLQMISQTSVRWQTIEGFQSYIWSMVEADLLLKFGIDNILESNIEMHPNQKAQEISEIIGEYNLPLTPTITSLGNLGNYPNIGAISGSCLMRLCVIGITDIHHERGSNFPHVQYTNINNITHMNFCVTTESSNSDFYNNPHVVQSVCMYVQYTSRVLDRYRSSYGAEIFTSNQYFSTCPILTPFPNKEEEKICDLHLRETLMVAYNVALRGEGNKDDNTPLWPINILTANTFFTILMVHEKKKTNSNVSTKDVKDYLSEINKILHDDADAGLLMFESMLISVANCLLIEIENTALQNNKSIHCMYDSIILLNWLYRDKNASIDLAWVRDYLCSFKSLSLKLDYIETIICNKANVAVFTSMAYDMLQILGKIELYGSLDVINKIAFPVFNFNTFENECYCNSTAIIPICRCPINNDNTTVDIYEKNGIFEYDGVNIVREKNVNAIITEVAMWEMFASIFKRTIRIYGKPDKITVSFLSSDERTLFTYPIEWNELKSLLGEMIYNSKRYAGTHELFQYVAKIMNDEVCYDTIEKANNIANILMLSAVLEGHLYLLDETEMQILYMKKTNTNSNYFLSYAETHSLQMSEEGFSFSVPTAYKLKENNLPLYKNTHGNFIFIAEICNARSIKPITLCSDMWEKIEVLNNMPVITTTLLNKNNKMNVIPMLHIIGEQNKPRNMLYHIMKRLYNSKIKQQYQHKSNLFIFDNAEEVCKKYIKILNKQSLLLIDYEKMHIARKPSRMSSLQANAEITATLGIVNGKLGFGYGGSNPNETVDHEITSFSGLQRYLSIKKLSPVGESEDMASAITLACYAAGSIRASVDNSQYGLWMEKVKNNDTKQHKFNADKPLKIRKGIAYYFHEINVNTNMFNIEILIEESGSLILQNPRIVGIHENNILVRTENPILYNKMNSGTSPKLGKFVALDVEFYLA